MSNPVFAALDTADLTHALAMAKAVGPHVGGLKVGLEFFCAQGPEGVRQIVALGKPVFLDIKLHDIPNTVAGAIRSVAPLGVAYVTIHCSGGPGMLGAAVEAAALAGPDRPRLLGVSVLTSLDDGDLAAVGQKTPSGGQVDRLAGLALECGLDGLIAAPPEIARLRQNFGQQPILMIPGIRPAGADPGDQKRVMTPAAAMAAGADYLV
ncbi:MAG: orotidine-5'-phosphate decarboxylase, partial [Alphaproteobacteria bacterium]